MRDKADKVFRDKLYGHTVEPPAPVWERIERDLAAVATDSRVPAAPVAPAVAPSRRLWPAVARYGAAASLLAALVVTGILLRPGVRPDDRTADAAATPATPAGNAQEMIPAPGLAMSVAPTAIRSVVRKILTIEPIEEFTGKQTLSVMETLPEAESEPVSEPTAGPAIGPATESAAVPDTSSHSTPDDSSDAGQQTYRHTPQQYYAAPTRNVYNPIRANSLRRRNLSATLYAVNVPGSGNSTSPSQPMSYHQQIYAVSRADLFDQTPELTSHRHELPLSFGAGVSFGVSRSLSIETGLSYSMLRSEFEYAPNTTIRQELHYIGVPVALLWDFADAGPLSFYVRGGGMLEVGVAGNMATSHNGSGEVTDRVKMRGVVPSLNAAAGAEVALGRTVGIYVEPGVNLYPRQGDGQPSNYRTENPLTFGLKAGLRFNFGR